MVLFCLTVRRRTVGMGAGVQGDLCAARRRRIHKESGSTQDVGGRHSVWCGGCDDVALRSLRQRRRESADNPERIWNAGSPRLHPGHCC